MSDLAARVDAWLVREIAAASSTDPRSVEKVLRGERVRGMADARIRRELSARKITPPSPTSGR